MKIEISAEMADEMVATIVLEAIQGTSEMCDELVGSYEELEDYEMQDLNQGMKDLKALIPAFKYFSPKSEHYKVYEYENK